MLRLDDATAYELAIIASAADENIMMRELQPKIAKTIEAVGSWQVKALGIEGAFNIMDGRVLTYLDEFAGAHIRGINRTTRKILMEALADGVRRGEGTQQLARRIRKSFDGATKHRSYAIAKTEVTSASSYARERAMTDAGPEIVAGKKWIATRDRRTRDQHRKLQGQVVSIDGYFSMNGDRAKRPGGFSQAKHNVNCRCTIVPVAPKIDTRMDTIMGERKQLAEFDTMYEELLEETAFAVARAFRNQEKAVIMAAKGLLR